MSLRPAVRTGESGPSRANLRVRSDDGAVVYTGEMPLAGPPEQRTGLLSIEPSAPLRPGLYHVDVSLPEAPFSPSAVTTNANARCRQTPFFERASSE